MTYRGDDPALVDFASVIDSGGSLDLAVAALAIARMEYPRLDAPHYLSALDEMASVAAKRLQGASDAYAQINALSGYLFDELGFAGNDEDYYDPRNSFLNDVLDRRRGIPISLSVVYIEVAARLKLPMVGAGMPGHFLVKYLAPDEEIIVDPFHRGIILTNDECAALFAASAGYTSTFRPEMLAAVPAREIIARMLNNLKQTYVAMHDYERALAVVERLLIVQPEHDHELRARATLRYQLGDVPGAIADLESYAARAAAAPDIDDVRQQINAMRDRLGSR